MPDAIITSTESTFGTISGTFAADQSTITGTVTGIVAGTLSGSVGVPGPAGAGVPAGGTAGQYLQKIDGVDYNTDWVTLNLSAYAPLNSPAFTGNPTAPTAALGDNDTSLATTAFVQQELASGTAVAKNLEVYVRNQTGSTLAAGAIVYINGATGNRPTVTLAQANNDANSAQTFGFVKAAIANNGFGYVIVRGECENLDTSALTEGVQLYLSPTTPGAWTTTKPSAPQHLVYVGIVVRSHPTQGTILVAVQNGYELDELHDVSIVSKANNDLIAYDSATTLWKNKSIGTLGLATQAWVDAQGYLQAGALTGYALESWVTAGFYPLTGNPSGFLTSASLTGYATESFVTSQGYITSSALSPYLLSSTAASTYRALSNNTFGNIQVNSGNSITINDGGIYPNNVFLDNAGLDIVNGTTFAQVAAFRSDQVLIPSVGITFSDATTQTSAGITAATADASYYPLTGNPSSYLVAADITGKANLSGATFTGKVNTVASASGGAGLNIPHGSAPSSPVNGDIWSTTGNIQWRRNGSTQTIPNQGTSNTFSAGAKQTVSHSSTTAGLNIGPVAGDPSSLANGDVWLNSTTNDLKARINGVTETIAEQSWVTAQGYLTSAPVTSVAGKTGAVSLVVGDVSGAAPLASPTFTGTPAAPTASAGTSTTQLATTAFVTTADNLKADLASPTFTGTPSAPTATAGTNTTQIATTAFVRTDNNVKAWVNFNGTGTVAIRSSFNVTSVTDNGTGTYTVNLTNAISTNAIGVAMVSDDATAYRGVNLQGGIANITTTSYKLNTFRTSGTQEDCSVVQLAIFR